MPSISIEFSYNRRPLLFFVMNKKISLSEEITISSLEGIWTKSGFSSKTSFFTSFKEETGMTPIEFIECSPLALG
jgi:AraC-like DNA-binding protein